MSNKALQRQRMMGYFIRAAMDIITEHGVGELSVRNVAKLAGYSYATIYNYFKDLDHLKWYVAVEYLKDIAGRQEEYSKQNADKGDSVALIKGSFSQYVGYYLEHPTVYRFLFFDKLADIPSELVEEAAQPNLLNHLKANLRQCAADGLVNIDDVPIVANVLTNMVHGLLTMFFASKAQLNVEQLLAQLNQNIDYLLSKSC